MACKFRFNVIHLEKSWREPANEPMLIGGEVAAFLKTYREFCYTNSKEQDPEYLWGLFRKWENTGRWTNAETARQFCKNFLRSEFALVPLKSQSDYCLIEQKMTFDKNLVAIRGEKAWFDPGAAFRVVGDFIYRRGTTLTIVDDKTGWGTPDPKQLDILMTLVPRAIPALDASGIWHVEAAFNVLSGYRPETIRVPVKAIHETSDGTAPILADLKEVNSWPEKFKDGYPATPCTSCEHCTIPTCPIGKEVAMALASAPGAPSFTLPEKLNTPEEAQKAVVFVSFMGRLEKQIKELLKKYVDQNGRVVSGGMEATYDNSESMAVEDMGQLIDLLVAYKTPPALILDALSLSKSELEKIIKKANLEERRAMIMQLVQISTSRRFYVRKNKGPAQIEATPISNQAAAATRLQADFADVDSQATAA
jgi:hypothetical protein